MENELYTQCLLHFYKEKDRSSYQVDIIWIPKVYAKVGKTIVVEETQVSWEVIKLFETRDYSFLKLHERDYLYQRGESDIDPVNVKKSVSNAIIEVNYASSRI